MKREIIARVLEEADMILETKETIRGLAKKIGVSKSTVHKDLQDRLLYIDKKKHEQVQKLMQHNLDVRHIRGGESTRKKYSLKSSV